MSRMRYTEAISEKPIFLLHSTSDIVNEQGIDMDL